MRSRYLLATMPKSGTYLLAEVLEQLGISNTHWHLGVNRWQDYSKATQEEARLNPGKFTKNGRAKQTASAIPPGSFAASHLGPRHLRGVRDLKVLFLHRDLRETIPSWAKWIRDSRRWSNKLGWMDGRNDDSVIAGFLEEHGELVAKENNDVVEWWRSSNCLKIAHGSLIGRYGQDAQRLTARNIAEFLGEGICEEAVSDAIERALASKTLTKTPESGENSRKLLWGTKSERYFQESTLKTINERLGYEFSGMMHLRESYHAAKKAEIPCPICGCEDKRVLMKKDRYNMNVTINACTLCLHGYVSPVPDTRWFDEFYKNIYWKIYSFGGMENERALSESRAEQIICKVKPLIGRSPLTIMDVGCGSCGMIPVIRKAYPKAKLIATDPSSEAVDRARVTGADEVYQTAWRDSEEKGSGPEGVDFATCIHVLEHVKDPIEMLSNLRIAMKENAYIYIEVPNLLSDKWFGRGFFHLAHVSYFGPKSLQLALEKSGFEPNQIFEGVTKEWPWGLGVLAVAAESKSEAKFSAGHGMGALERRVRKQVSKGRPSFSKKAIGKAKSMFARK